MGALTRDVIVVDLDVFNVPTDWTDGTGVPVVPVLWSSCPYVPTLRAVQTEVIAGVDPIAANLARLLTESTGPARQVLLERKGETDGAVAITVVVESTLNLEGAEPDGLREVLRPLLHYLRVIMVNDHIRNRVLAHLEDDGVDERIGQEVVAAELEELLDTRWQVSVRNVEEGTGVVQCALTATLNTSTR